MILGVFDLHAYTVLHTIISLVGIVTGFIVILGMIADKRLDGWTFVFLLFTVLTSLTGFAFPNDKITPAIIVGIISLVVLLVAIVARYSLGLAGAWRWIFVITAIVAQWFNVFVLVAQGFMKVPALKALAPTQSEPPFLIAQTVVMLGFIVLTIMSVRKFKPLAA